MIRSRNTQWHKDRRAENPPCFFPTKTTALIRERLQHERKKIKVIGSETWLGPTIKGDDATEKFYCVAEGWICHGCAVGSQ